MRWHILLFVLLLLVAVFIIPLGTTSAEGGKRWPQPVGNAQNNVVYPIVGPDKEPSVKWVLNLEYPKPYLNYSDGVLVWEDLYIPHTYIAGYRVTGPTGDPADIDSIHPFFSYGIAAATGPDGTIYVSVLNNYDGYDIFGKYFTFSITTLYSITPDGRVRWNLSLKGASGPVTTPDGSILMVAPSYFCKISPNGFIEKNVSIGVKPYSLIYIDPSDVIAGVNVGNTIVGRVADPVDYGNPMVEVINLGNDKINLINFTNPEFSALKNPSGYSSYHLQAVDQHGVAYFPYYFCTGAQKTPTYFGIVRVDLKSGSVSYTKLRDIPPGTPGSKEGITEEGSNIIVGPDGTVYVSFHWLGTMDLFALNPDMSLKWHKTFSSSNTVDYIVLAASTDTVYAITYNLTVLAYSLGGDLKWSLKLPAGEQPVPLSRLLDYKGNLYVGSYNGSIDRGMLAAISPSGTVKWVYWFPPYIFPNPTLALGSIYILANNITFWNNTFLYKFTGFDPLPSPARSKISVALAPDYSLWVLLLITMCVAGFAFASRGKIVLGISFIASAVAVYYVILRPFVSLQTLVTQAQQLLSNALAQIPLGPILPAIVAIAGIAVLLKILKR